MIVIVVQTFSANVNKYSIPGLRFGLLQTKIGLITILRDYEVILNQETCTPLIMDPTSPILASKYTIWLNRE